MLEITNIKVYDLVESMKASGYSMSDGGFIDYVDSDIEKSVARCKRLAKKPLNSGHNNWMKGVRVSFDVRYPQYWSMEAQRYNFFDIVTSSSKMHTILKMDLRRSVNKYVSTGTIDRLERLVSFYNDISEAYNTNDSEQIYLRTAAYKTYTARSYNGCTYEGSTLKDFKYDCFMRILSNCPMGLELVMRVSTNYLQLANMYAQRKNHYLKEDWGAFCKFVESLPFSHLFLTRENGEEAAND